MFKKSFLTFGLLAGLIGQALANGGTFVQQQPTGIYFGGAIGGDWARYKNNLVLNENATNKLIVNAYYPPITIFENFNQTTPFNFRKSPAGVDGGAFIGYKTFLHPNIYLALEGFGDISSNKKSWVVPFVGASFAEFTAFAFNNNVHVSTHFKGEAGVRLRAGAPINALNYLYFLTGFSEGFFRFHQSNLLLGQIPPINLGLKCGFSFPVELFNFNSNFDKNISKPGLQLGGGWERIVNNFGIRVQYAATFYKNLTFNNIINLPPNIPFSLRSNLCQRFGEQFSLNNGGFASQLNVKNTLQQLTFGVFYQL
jgi:hypothetical protein